jgi:hypothetical protein
MSCTPETFTALTNSLETVRVDRAKVNALLAFQNVQVDTKVLEKIEFGYTRKEGKRIPAFVLHCSNKKFVSFTLASAPDTDAAVRSALVSLANLRDHSNSPGIPRCVVIDLGRYEEAPDKVQKACSFDFEHEDWTRQHLYRAESRLSPSLAIGEFWEDKEPPRFEKVSEYEMKAFLNIRRKGL